ncbi:MAG: transglutaminase domain-containing protein [Lachnospiraceae bacterium]|nr:transglutaminase domain-containing protein [Lachnospiraceae bacterium]
MKKKMKRAIVMMLILILSITVLPEQKREVQAAEQKKVMTVTIKDSYKTTTAAIYASPYSVGYYDFEMEKESFSIMKKAATDQIQVQVSIDDPSLIVADSLQYDASIALNGTNSNCESISFRYQGEDGVVRNDSVSYWIYPFEANFSIDNLVVSTSSKGFHPSKGNYLPIRSMITSSYGTGSAVLKVRVLNSKGKYVFQKKYSVGTGRGYLDYRWNGKASKNNEAGVKSGSYVKAGTYRIYLILEYEGNGYKKTVTKAKKFKVSKKAPSGTSGIAKASSVPVLTGNPNVDYMAEQMIKSAGVRSSMSADQKVKKIYHYMTTHFKHVHYSYGSKYKVYYNTTKLKSKITAYQKKTDASMAKGKLVYSFYGYYSEWNMARRIGVCNDHAMIFKILCNHVGIDAGTCSGYYKNRNGTLAGHAWNYAVVNGKTYYYDVDIEIQNYKKGQGDYYWYKKTKSQAKKTHQFY